MQSEGLAEERKVSEPATICAYDYAGKGEQASSFTWRIEEGLAEVCSTIDPSDAGGFKGLTRSRRGSRT